MVTCRYKVYEILDTRSRTRHNPHYQCQRVTLSTYALQNSLFDHGHELAVEIFLMTRREETSDEVQKAFCCGVVAGAIEVYTVQ